MHIEKGSKWGEKIELYGEGEHSSDVGIEAGDAVIVLKPKETEASLRFAAGNARTNILW